MIRRIKLEKDKECIVAAIIVFQQISNDFGYIGQLLLDNGVDYKCIKRLQNIDIKLDNLINYMRGVLS